MTPLTTIVDVAKQTGEERVFIWRCCQIYKRATPALLEVVRQERISTTKGCRLLESPPAVQGAEAANPTIKAFCFTKGTKGQTKTRDKGQVPG